MYVITGITGKVGGALARALLAARQPVRAIVRDIEKGRAWAAQGCEIACADMQDAASLAAAFSGAEGANLLTQRTLMEQALGELAIPVTFLRPGWFMENAAWDVASARDEGVVASFLQPLDKPVPMVATADVGRVAAELLQQTWIGRRIVELEGPHRIAPRDIAAAFSNILGHTVRVEAVPRDTWMALFVSQGMRHPLPRIRMLDGFNEGWIDFEGGQTGPIKGNVELETVLRELVDRAG